MSHWEYRIGFKRHSFGVVDDVTHEPTVDVVEEIAYGLIEAYYNDKGDLWMTTERFIEPSGETKEELIENLEMMLKDAKKAYNDAVKMYYQVLAVKYEGFVERRVIEKLKELYNE